MKWEEKGKGGKVTPHSIPQIGFDFRAFRSGDETAAVLILGHMRPTSERAGEGVALSLSMGGRGRGWRDEGVALFVTNRAFCSRWRWYRSRVRTAHCTTRPPPSGSGP